MIGRTISHYRIVEKLGEGGMGVVYIAEDTLLGRRVAFKTLTARSGDNQHFRARFLREARAVSALSHPHIAHIYDYGETDEGSPYIVMELIKGETLSDLMHKEKLTIPRSIEIIKQVAEALGEAHAQGIIHRDIKPSNVAINERGNVKVLDFGLAKQLGPGPINVADTEQRTLLNTQTREGMIVGTPLYLSPEQALGVDVDARSDLFAVGSLLYECIAGKPAFDSGSPVEICARIIREDPPPPSQINPDVPEELDDITKRALAKKPEARYQNAQQMIDDLEAARTSILGLDRTVTRMVSPGQGTHPTGALATLSDIFRRPRLPIGYVVGGVILIALIAFAVWRYTRPTIHPPSPAAKQLYDRAVEAMRESAYFRASKLLEQAVQEDDEFALAHARLAECWMELDSSDKAQSELIRALTLVPNPSVLPQVDSLKIQAVTKTVQRDFAKAVDDYRTLASAVPINERAFALVDLGRAYERSEQTPKAIESYQQSTQLDSRRAAAYLRVGIMLGKTAKFADAYNALDQAYKLFDIDANIEALSEVLLQRGVVLGLEGKSAEARNVLLQALEKSGVLENKDKRIKVLLNLSNTEIIAGNLEQAQQYSKEAVELAKANGLDNLTMQGLIDIGNAYLKKGKLPEAEQNYTEALRLAELYKGERSKARASLQMASLKSQQGDIEGVRKFFQMALPFYEKGGYRNELLNLYAILERAETASGSYDAAQQRLDELRKLASDQQSLALVEEDFGSLFADRQNVPEALRHYDESYRIYKSLDAKVAIGYTQNNRASQLWQLAQYDNANAAIDEALQIAQPPGRDPNLQLLALVHLTKSRMALSAANFADAITNGNKALELSSGKFKSIEVRAGFTVGLAEARSGNTVSGKKKCETALALARTLTNYDLLSQALLAYAEASLFAGDAPAGLASAGEAQQRFTTAQQHEGEWRALAIQALATLKSGDKTRASEIAAKARTALAALEQLWGGDSFRQYAERKDIKSLMVSASA
ncbi:MAG TPA: protein kinase [Pyrinomonadaceae bacterium]|jgi:tetratricopeptide (TPR) repeat protein/predicted Ser/Thr protein kinase|nr:protein kinase [Pyrinomonadaceae bacterium]